ncbi:MAG: methyl-accepting chemotaxis protein [Sphaerotilus natans subsp. sulfidivorans]|nr:methyl-accepting chemotaxis protein [Sphaerotilus sulfidivorans]
MRLDKSGLQLPEMSVSARLHLGFSIVLILVAVLGLLGYLQNEEHAKSTQRLVSEDAVRASLTNDLQITVQQMVIVLGDLTQQEDPEEITRLQKSFQASSEQYLRLKDALLKVPQSNADVDAEWKGVLQTMVETETGAHQLFIQMADMAGRSSPSAVRTFYEMQVFTPLTAWMENLARLRSAMAVSMKSAVEASQQSAKVAQTMTVAMVCAALGVGLLSTFLISRSITLPLQRAVALAETVAKGDLTVDVSSDQKDEVGVLLNALGNMQASLRSLVGDICQCADSIRTACTEVAIGNVDLSQRTEQAASSLQRTAASLDTMTGTVHQSAESASRANQLATSAIAAASRGGQVMQQVVSNMADISEASRKISDIIAVIDGIAFQTNLLALNAAVEAARAGEQGRGFAVVAEEVRHLAQRAATAAREIKSLIGSSVGRVESGAMLVHEAGDTMRDIVAAVRSVNEVIAEITVTTSEQSSSIAEVNDAVDQLDRMTQQNAALVEQSAAASESLREQANRMNGLVGSFQLDRPLPSRTDPNGPKSVASQDHPWSY